MAGYLRPAPPEKLDKPARERLLREYHAHYASAAKANPDALNVKLPREALAPLLDELGGRLLEEAERLAREPGPVREFLDANPLPPSLEPHLPDSFRAFCLALNALKQWVAAESLATDRYLLGGGARKECRAAAETCAVTGESLGDDAELHHPVRDGRPPILISKAGHALIENQVSRGGDRSPSPSSAASSPSARPTPDDGIMAVVRGVKRNESWRQLRRGCLDHLGREAHHSSSAAVQANARAFAARASRATGLTYEALLEWMDTRALGRGP